MMATRRTGLPEGDGDMLTACGSPACEVSAEATSLAPCGLCVCVGWGWGVPLSGGSLAAWPKKRLLGTLSWLVGAPQPDH